MDEKTLGRRELMGRLTHGAYDLSDCCQPECDCFSERYDEQLESLRKLIENYQAGNLTGAREFYNALYLSPDKQESYATLVGGVANGELRVAARMHGFAEALDGLLSLQKVGELPKTVAYDGEDFTLESRPAVVYFEQEIDAIKRK